LLKDYLDPKSSEKAEQHKFMSGFHYDIVFRKTEDHKIVDFLSRFPLPCKNDDSTTKNDDVSCFLNHQIETMPITPKEIESESSKDNELRDLCITQCRQEKDQWILSYSKNSRSISIVFES
jgi:hypothetical protein